MWSCQASADEFWLRRFSQGIQEQRFCTCPVTQKTSSSTMASLIPALISSRNRSHRRSWPAKSEKCSIIVVLPAGEWLRAGTRSSPWTPAEPCSAGLASIFSQQISLSSASHFRIPERNTKRFINSACKPRFGASHIENRHKNLSNYAKKTTLNLLAIL